MDRPIKNKAMPLIIVRSTIVLPNIEIVDWRTEEELSDVVERLGIGVRDAVVSPTRRPLDKRNMHAIVIRIGAGRILAVVRRVRSRSGPICRRRRNASWQVRMHGDNEV